MIKSKITKIDGNTVYLLTEHNDEIAVDRATIDFGILQGDILFLRTEAGNYKYRRLEKGETEDDEPHYYDADWKKRENEHQIALNSENEKYNQIVEQEKEKNTMINMALWFTVAVILILLIVAFKDKIGVFFVVS